MIEEQLSAYLARQWGKPVAISGIKRFHGGAARQTYRFDATVAGAAKRGLVLRRDPPSSLIDTDRRIEFEAIRSAWNAGLPVPEVLFIETGSEAFGSPAFLMAEVPGVHAAGLFDADPYGEARGAVGTQLFSILGRIHSMDPQSVAHVLDRPDPADAWAVRLDHWRAAVAAHNSGPEPVIAAGFRWHQL